MVYRTWLPALWLDRIPVDQLLYILPRQLLLLAGSGLGEQLIACQFALHV